MEEQFVVVVGDTHNGSSYYRPFAEIAPQGSCELIFTDPEKVVCAVFTGGEDVDPVMYDEVRNPKTYCNIVRDQEEQMYFDEALEHKIPMAGICRGAQFLCVMSGGKLAQNVWNHSFAHTIRTSDGKIVEVTSTHHQMQLPPPNSIILAWADPKRSDRYEGGTEHVHPELEYEGVYYPDTNALSMQWHPEYMKKDSQGFQYSVDIIRKLIAGELK